MHLRRYLANFGISVATFADTIGVTVQAVHRYVNGERIPNRDVMERIALVTGGKVQPNDFYSVPPSGACASMEAEPIA